MKFTVEREPLFEALSKTRSIVNSRNTIPILSNARIVAQDGTLAIRGSDLDQQVDTIIPAQVDAPGSTTIGCHIAYDIVKTLPKKATVSFELDSGSHQMMVRSGRAKFNLGTLDALHYPKFEAASFTHTFKVSRSDLTDLLGKTIFAASTDQSRHYLIGVYLHCVHGELRACATDGHRLALVVKDAPSSAVGFDGLIIPSKAVQSIISMATEPEVEVSVSRSMIRLDFGSAVLLAKAIDGTFPDYQRVIPTNNNRRLVIDRDALVNAVTRCAAVGYERGSLVRLDISQASGLVISSRAETGTAREELDAEFEDGELTIGFNGRYLTDVAARFAETDTLVMMLNDPGSPALIASTAETRDKTVIMPMRV